MRTRSWLVVVLVAVCLMLVAGVASAQVVDYKPLTLSDGPAEVAVGETTCSTRGSRWWPCGRR